MKPKINNYKSKTYLAIKMKPVSAYHGRYEQGFIAEGVESGSPHKETHTDTTVHVHKCCSQQGRRTAMLAATL